MLKISSKFIFTLFTNIIFGFGISHAALIEKDWKNAGDGLITLDTSTGLDWLDLTVSQGQYSFDSIQSEFSPGGKFKGFRLADRSDIDSLLSSFGLTQHDLSDTAGDRAEVKNYLSLLGIMQSVFSVADAAR